VGLRERIEQIERFLGRVHLLWWLLPSSVLTLITGILGYIRDAPFGVFVAGLIAAFAIPSLGLAALFFAANRLHRNSKHAGGSQVDKSLVPLDVYLEINDDPTITYKRKLRIVLRNESGRHITVRTTSWQRRSNDDIQLRSQDRYLWQIEESPGSWEDNKWRPGETTEISAGPGAAIWTYIGLHDQATDHGVRRRLVQGRRGTLVVVLMTDGQMVEQRTSLGPIRI
jgi:hypothetical protein